MCLAATGRSLAADGPRRLAQIGGVDDYTFTVPAPSPQQFVFDALTPVSELQWSLTGPGGPVVTARSFTQSDSFNGSDASAVLTLPPGPYRLSVGHTGNQAPEYDFRLLRVSDASAITPGVAVQGALDPGSATRLYQFPGAVGDQVRLRLAVTNLPAGVLARLCDPFGRVMTRTSGGESSPVTLIADGSHLLLVEGSVRAAGPGTFGVVVEPLGNQSPFLPGEPLVLNRRVAVGPSGPFTNRYRFALPVEGRLVLTPHAAGPQARWELLGPSGVLESRRMDDDRHLLAVAPAGEYQLTVWADAGVPSAFEWTLQEVSASPTLGLGVLHRITNVFNSDDLFFRVPLSAGQAVYASAASSGGFNSGPGWQVWDPYGRRVFEQGWFDTSFRAGFPGDYLLRLTGAQSDTGQGGVREFRLIGVTDPEQGLVIGQRVSGRLEMPGQVRTYRFSQESPGRVVLDTLAASTARWELTGPLGPITSGRFFSDLWASVPLLAGEHRLVVSASGPETPDFDFRLLDPAAGELIGVGDVVTRPFDPASAIRQFRVALTEGQKVYPRWLSQEGFGNGNPRWRLEGPSGQVVFDTTAPNEPGAFVAPATGVYSLRIGGPDASSGTGTVTFSLIPVTDTTVPLALGTPVNDTLQTPGQERRYTFSVIRPTRISVDILESSDAIFRLTGPAGDLNSGTRLWSENWWVYDLLPGNYQISVVASGPAPAPVRFQVLAASDGPTLTLNVEQRLEFPSVRASRWARVSLEAGQRLFAEPLDPAAGSGNAPRWRLMSPAGQVLFDDEFVARNPWVAPVQGVYDLLIGGRLSQADSPASVAFNLRTVPVADQTLVLGADVSDALSTPGEQKRYTFSLAEDAWLSFDTRLMVGLTWRLTGPWGVVGESAFWSDPWQPRQAPPGDYVLEVFGNGAETGPFRFSLLDILAGTPLALGAETTAEFLPNNSTRGYVLDLPAGQRVTARRLARNNIGTGPLWTLVDPNGTRLFESFSAEDSTATTLMAGRHALLLVGWSGETSAGGTMRFVVEDGGVSPPAAFAGTPVTPGDEISGALPDAASTNAFTFTLADTAWLHLDRLADSGQLVTVRNRHRVLHSDRPLAGSDWSGPTDWMLFRAEPGDYQIVVRGPGAYRFRLMNAAEAPRIATEVPVAITNAPANTSQWRRLAGRAGDRITLLPDGYSGFDQRPGLTLWNPSGTYNTSWFSDILQEWTLPQTGDYYLLFSAPTAVTASEGVHRLRLVPARDSVHTLALNTPTDGVIPVAGGGARYDFALSAPARVAFDAIAKTPTARIWWRLTSADRVWRRDTDFASADVNASPTGGEAFLDLPPGAYSLHVRSANTADTPSFRFALWDVNAVAEPLALNTWVSGTNQPSSQSRFFRFDAAAGDPLVFDGRGFSGFDRPAYAGLYFPVGPGQDLSRLDRLTDRFTVPVSGRYQLIVSGVPDEASPAGRFDFVMWRPQDRTNVLTLGATVREALDIPGLRSSHRLLLNQPTLLLFDNLDLAANPLLTLRGAGEQPFSSTPVKFHESNDDRQARWLPAGEYLATFQLQPGETNALRFRFLDASTAREIQPGSPVTVSFAEAHSTEVVRFRATAGDRFYLRADGSSGFAQGTPFARLFTARGDLVARHDFRSDVSTFTVPSTGDYVYVINGVGWASPEPATVRFTLLPVLPGTPNPLFPVVAEGPDLVISAPQAGPSPVLSGGRVQVTWSVRNAGNAPVTGAFLDRVVIRNAAGAVLALGTSGAGAAPLPAGGTISRQVDLTLPQGPSATGPLEVEITTDADGGVAEFNSQATAESNNRASLSIEGRIAPYPDLRVAGVVTTPAGGWIPGDTVTVGWTATNAGDGPARAPWRDRVRIVNQTTGVPVAEGDAPAGGDLAPGASVQRSFAFPVPQPPHAFGRFLITVTADAGSAVFEHAAGAEAEANNTASATVVTGPDLAVLEVLAPPAVTPGEPFDVITWITNRGSVLAAGSWIQRYATSRDAQVGDDTPILFASLTTSLPPGGSVRVTNAVTLPVAGDAGRVWMVVTADAGLSIPEANRDDNTGISTASTEVARVLSLLPSATSVRENAPTPLGVTIGRSGPADAPLTVSLQSDAPGHLEVPGSVVIPAGQQTATFEARPVPDDVLEGTQPVQLTATAPGFPEARTTISVLDDTTARLEVAFDAAEFSEGGAARLRITRTPRAPTPLTVQLQVSDPSRVTVPAQVTIPGGEDTVSVILPIPQNATLQGPQTVTLGASAPAHLPGTGSFRLLDDDLPQVTLEIRPRSVSEGAGPTAASVTLTRSPVAAVPVVVGLTVGVPGRITVPSTATIPAGQAAVVFPVGVVDNALVDGPRSVSLGGWVLETGGAGRIAEVAPDLLTITDDDGPALTLVLERDAVPEGRDPATRVRVIRNTASDTALTVTLESSDPAEARLPATVLIPAGTNQVAVSVVTPEDNVTDGNQTVTLSATAPGYAPGTASLVVTDLNLPDLVVSRLVVPDTGIAGTVIPVSFRVENNGFAPVTTGFLQSVSLNTSPVFGGGTLAAQLPWNSPLAPGASLDQTANVRLPAQPGTYWIVVHADAARQVEELVEGNNIQISESPVAAGASYEATVSADPKVALANTPVTLSGRATRAADGSPAVRSVVDVHLQVKGIRRVLRAQTDDSGAFTTVFRPLPDEAGNYAVAASFPGLPMPPPQDRFTLQGLRVLPVSPLTVVESSSISGSTLLENLSDLPLSGLAVTVLSNSPGYQVTAQLAGGRVEGDAEIALGYAVAALESARGNGFAHLRVTSAEGASADLILSILLERLTPRLVAEPGALSETMALGQQRVVTFRVVNRGGAATGPLELVASTAPWLSLATPSPLAPLAPGGDLSVSLRLAPEATLPLAVYNGEVVLRSTNALLRVPFAFRAVSEARGDLRVTAEDEYTYFAEGAPRPTNAVVVLRDALSGAEVARAEGGSDGEALFEDLPEGDYLVQVTAEGHHDFQRTVHVSGAAGAPAVPAASAGPEAAFAAARSPVSMRADAGSATTEVTAFLPRQTVRYNFSVTPTQVEDRYTITIESTFETQVPVPVITVDPPSVDLTLFAEDEFQINFTVSNQGLIAAQNVEFTMPSTSAVQMTPLINRIGRLAARSSINIPVLVRRGAAAAAASAAGSGLQTRSLRHAARQASQGIAPRVGFGGCTALGQVVYSYPCGPSEINGSAPVAVQISNLCNALALAAAMGDAFASAFGGLPYLCCSSGSGPGNGNGYSPIYIYSSSPVVSTSSDCSAGGGGVGGSSAALARTSAPRTARTVEDPGSEGAVCAKVRLRLDQRAVLTRDAFSARLELANDTDSPLTDLEVTLAVVDAAGEPANALFGIRDPEISGVTAVDGAGTLGAQSAGRVQWTLIPSLNAAPTEGVRKFLVGGTIVYRQDGVRITVPLTPASIDVHPQPELVVRYFHERDVFSDDPFTRVLEPAVPYALAAQVVNAGFGPARALRIESGQPQIIENEKGLLIDFLAIGTRVENQEISPSLTVNLGEIAPGTNKLARWLFTSSLQGSFTNFTATFRQQDAIAGVERLSLIRSVEIHELTRIVSAPGALDDGRPDLLVNGEPDDGVLPDILYASDGTTRPVGALTNAVISGELSEQNLRLRLDAALPRGLSYLRVRHPGGTNFVLRQVLRPDGSDLGVGTNAWTTDRFIRGGARRPVRVDLLHLFDLDAPPFYTLVYAPAPPPVADSTPPVSRIAPLPESSPANFPVAWSATDDASGVFSYNIHVAEDGGPFRLWLTNSPLTSAIYSGRFGRTYGFVAAAIDRAGNIEPLRTVADAVTRVDAGNRPPVLTGPTSLSVQRGERLSASFAAEDPDPGQVVFFTLLPGAPRGLAVDPESGALQWQTGDGDVPGTYTVRVRASDNGLPSESATASVTITLLGENRPPVPEPVPDLLVTEGSPIAQAVVFRDPDLPRQQLRLRLVQGPANATLESDGILRWRPRSTDGPSTNRVVIRATDDGVPPLSADLAFQILVRDTAFDLLVGVGSTHLPVGEAGSVPLSLNSAPDLSAVRFQLPLPADRFAGLTLSSLADEVLSATVADIAEDQALVQFQLRPGASLTATRRIADLGFQTLSSGSPGTVRVLPLELLGTRTNGAPVPSSGASEGVIVLVGRDPILRMETGATVRLFGVPGRRYRVESAPRLDASWGLLTTVALTDDTATVNVADVDPSAFLRVIEAP